MPVRSRAGVGMGAERVGGLPVGVVCEQISWCGQLQINPRQGLQRQWQAIILHLQWEGSRPSSPLESLYRDNPGTGLTSGAYEAKELICLEDS